VAVRRLHYGKSVEGYKLGLGLGLGLGLELGLGLLTNHISDFYRRANTKNLLKWRYLHRRNSSVLLFNRPIFL